MPVSRKVNIDGSNNQFYSTFQRLQYSWQQYVRDNIKLNFNNETKIVAVVFFTACGIFFRIVSTIDIVSNQKLSLIISDILFWRSCY